MRVCPHCGKDLPDDSIFCTYCGRPLEKVKKENVKSKNTNKTTETKAPRLKKNPHNNIFGKLGVFLFFIGLFVFDFIIATVVHNISGDSKPVFIISAVIYVLSIVCGLLCFYVDHKDKKNGYEPNGGIQFAMMSIIMSILTILVNLNTVL